MQLNGKKLSRAGPRDMNRAAERQSLHGVGCDLLGHRVITLVSLSCNGAKRLDRLHPASGTAPPNRLQSFIVPNERQGPVNAILFR